MCISHSFRYILPSDPQTCISVSFLQSRGQEEATLPDVLSRVTQNDIGTSNTCLLKLIKQIIIIKSCNNCLFLYYMMHQLMACLNNDN